MMLALFAGHADRDVDRAAVSAIEALVRQDSLPWWLPEAMVRVLERYADPNPRYRLGIDEPDCDEILGVLADRPGSAPRDLAGGAAGSGDPGCAAGKSPGAPRARRGRRDARLTVARVPRASFRRAVCRGSQRFGRRGPTLRFLCRAPAISTSRSSRDTASPPSSGGRRSGQTVTRVYCLRCGSQVPADRRDADPGGWWVCARGCNTRYAEAGPNPPTRPTT